MHCKKAFPQGKVAWAKPMTDEGNAEVFAATTLKRPKPSPRRGEGGTAQP